MKNHLQSVVSLALLASMPIAAAATPAAQNGIGDWPSVVGSTIWTVRAQPGWVPEAGSVLDFSGDGTGTSYERLGFFADLTDPAAIPASFTWSASGGTLELVYADLTSVSFPAFSYPYDALADIYNFDQSVVDFLNLAFENGEPIPFQIQLTTRTVSTTHELVSVIADRASVASTQQIEYSIDELLTDLNWPGDLPRGLASGTSDALVYLPGAVTNGLQNPPVVGDTWAVPRAYEPIDPRVTDPTQTRWNIDLYTLEAAGQTSNGVLSQQAFTWSVTTDGLVFDSGNERYTYTPIETDGSNYLALTTYSVNGAVQLRSAGWVARSDGTGATLAGDLVEPIPQYWQAGISAWQADAYRPNGQLRPSFVFGYSLAGDATSFRVFAGSDNCLADEFDPCFVAEELPMPWSWTAMGDTIVREVSLPDFQFTRERTWTVLSYQSGGRATVFEWAVRQFGENPYEFLIYPRLNTLALADLSSWPEEWANAQGLYPPDDADGDGIADAADNCLQLAASDLRDTDGDRIGNLCDADLNQDCQVNVEDLGLLRSVFFTTPADDNWNPSADFNGDNVVNVTDLGVMRTQFFMPPGPSGVPNLCD